MLRKTDPLHQSGNRLTTALLPSDPATQEIAKHLYELVRELPITSPHGHVDPQLLLENKPFANPAELFLYFDHYITRLLHAQGVSLEEIGKGERSDATARRAWKI